VRLLLLIILLLFLLGAFGCTYVQPGATLEYSNGQHSYSFTMPPANPDDDAVDSEFGYFDRESLTPHINAPSDI
jgi:hypothetical protein